MSVPSSSSGSVARTYANANNETVPAANAGEAWYQGAYDYCVANGIIDAKTWTADKLNANASLARWGYLLAHAVQVAENLSNLSAGDGAARRGLRQMNRLAPKRQVQAESHSNQYPFQPKFPLSNGCQAQPR